MRRRRRGRCAPTSRVKALDEFLDLPHLDVLFRLILTHFYTLRIRVPLIVVSKRESMGVLTKDPDKCQSFYFSLTLRPADPGTFHLNPLPMEIEPGTGPIRTTRTPAHRVNKLVPPRPFPTVPAGVSATGPRSAHHEGKNYITVTRKTKLGPYLRRCKDVVLKDGCVPSEPEPHNAQRADILSDTSPFISVLSAQPFHTSVN